MPVAQQIADAVRTWLFTHGFKIVLAIVLCAVGMRLAQGVVDRIFSRLAQAEEVEMQKRADTLRSLVRYLVSTTLLVVTTIVVLSELGVNVGPVLAAAGIVGLAVGFGSQQLVQDVISGFFILVEDQIRVGDVIETAGRAGLVESVTLRTTKLRDLAGNVHFIRNGKIDVVTNMTKDFSYAVFEIGVAYREDVDDVIAVLHAVDDELRADPGLGPDVLEPLEVLGLDRFADSAVIIKARTKTRPSRQWRVSREFNRRVKAAFDRRGIALPFPHVTVYAGQDKDGKAPVFPVALAPERRPG
jgi:small-conductance mechanosensitive channel